MNWSPQQEAIFRWCEAPQGHRVVRARAGTGKTTTIVEGVRRIPFAPGERALLCAFNKRIQLELDSRVKNDSVDVRTLHSLGFMYLKARWGHLNLDDDVEKDRIRSVIGDGPGWEVVLAIKKLISVAKGAAPFGSVDTLADLAVVHSCEVDDWHRFSIGDIADAAHKAMQLAKECDPGCRITFDDMLYVPVVNDFIVPLYDYVFVDEAQDMNQAQLLLAFKACKPGGHMGIIGDDRQAIYAFRGADSNALDRMKGELQAEELGLTVTYRCPTSVVAAVNKLVPDLEAAPGAPEGEVLHMGTGELLESAEPGDVILSRLNAPLVPLCLGLIRRSVPARIEGRDIGKMLAKQAKKFKAVSMEDFDAKLAKWANRCRRNAIALGRQVETRVQEVSDIEATLKALAEGCTSVQQIVNRCESMFADLEGSRNSMVVLSSVHKAKGLEWTRVYVLESTLYCYGKRRDSLEEQNIEYVAKTRAKETLVMVSEAAA